VWEDVIIPLPFEKNILNKEILGEAHHREVNSTSKK